MATVKRCSQSLPLAAMKSVFMPVIRQEYGQHPQKWQESADFIDQEDTGAIGNHTQHGGP